jgi:hypothetical protein
VSKGAYALPRSDMLPAVIQWRQSRARQAAATLGRATRMAGAGARAWPAGKSARAVPAPVAAKGACG